jgi:hypothetical protein
MDGVHRGKRSIAWTGPHCHDSCAAGDRIVDPAGSSQGILTCSKPISMYAMYAIESLRDGQERDFMSTTLFLHLWQGMRELTLRQVLGPLR